MRIEIYKDNSNEWRARWVSANGRVIAVLSESYHNFIDAHEAVQLIQLSLSAKITVIK